MRYKNKVSSFLLLLTLAFSSLSCEKQQASNNSISNSNTVTAPTVKAQSPTEAYKMLYAAVKAKDKATIRQLMSKGSLGMGEMLAGQQKKSIDQVLENGFVAPTLAPSITEIRDERIKGNIGLIEVRNEQEKNGKICRSFLKTAVGNSPSATFSRIRLTRIKRCPKAKDKWKPRTKECRCLQM